MFVGNSVFIAVFLTELSWENENQQMGKISHSDSFLVFSHFIAVARNSSIYSCRQEWKDIYLFSIDARTRLQVNFLWKKFFPTKKNTRKKTFTLSKHTVKKFGEKENIFNV